MRESVKNFIRAVGGVNDRVTTLDRLDVHMEQAPKVFCAACNTHIYYLRRSADGVHQFAPCEAGYPVRPDMVCPECGNIFTARLNGRPIIKTDGGWI